MKSSLLSKLFQFVSIMSNKYNIDESHGLGHSMRVFQFAEQIAVEEPIYVSNPNMFETHHPIIQIASILHDTCDKKYRDEVVGLSEIRDFLTPLFTPIQINVAIHIIQTMSYSKIAKNGMPNLGEFQPAFNTVREADLLDAYDFDRSMIYHMNRNGNTVEDAYKDASELFEKRVFKHLDDGLLTTKFALRQHPELTQKSLIRMHHWRNSLGS